jgi:hypothetical protein
MSLKKNRFWSWNSYTKELILFKPASLFVIWGVACFGIIVIGGILSQIF